MMNGTGRGGIRALRPWCVALLTLLLGLALPAVAQTQQQVAQPAAPAPLGDRNQPDAAELEMQRALRGGTIAGTISIPNQTASVLIQPEGRSWRGFRNRALTWIGAVAILGAAAGLGLYYLLKGKTRIKEGRSGRSVLRYDGLERINHWMVASSFVILGLSGLVVTYGRSLLLPWMGPKAFATLAIWCQAAHQFLSFPFVLGLILMLVLWAGQNLPKQADLAWLRAGGPMAKGNPPAGKFNAGQKLLYWFVLGCGAALAVSGYLLMFPFALTDIGGQQWAHMIHGVLAMLMIAAILGHIYIGTLGMEGAFEAMARGRVDYNWAKEHHRLWLEEELTQAHRTLEPPRRKWRAGAD